MRYEGRIKNINQIIVSDPSYQKGVWCRYENDEINMRNCKVMLDVSPYHETITAEERAEYLPDNVDKSNLRDLTVDGVEFRLLISDGSHFCNLTENGFEHSSWLKMKDYTIGMDTACVSLGINDVADRIRSEIDTYQPSTCLRTLTDGEFGTVFEGTTPRSDVTCLIYVEGYLCDDTEYTIDDILEYLTNNFSIEDLHPVEDAQVTNDDLEIGGI